MSGSANRKSSFFSPGDAHLLPPAYAAVIFTISQSVQAMFSSGSMYLPVLSELMYFIMGYVVLLAANSVVVFPICKLVPLRSWAGVLGLSVAIALAGCVAVFGSGFLKLKIFFGMFLPLTALTLTTFDRIQKHRRDPR